MEEMTFEEQCQELRKDIEKLKEDVCHLIGHDEFKNECMALNGANIPVGQHANMAANLTIVFRHLEDARMRVGKVLQAKSGGVSILNK